jgi:hypothetical protein
VSHETPLAAPIVVPLPGVDPFPVAFASVSARTMARWLFPPEDQPMSQDTERVIGNIAGLIEEAHRQRFLDLWDRTDATHAVLNDLWTEVITRYSARPTNGPSPSGSGSGTPSDGATSTHASSSPVTPASMPSPTTPDGS